MHKNFLLLFILIFGGVTYAESFYPISISNMEATVRIHGHGTIEDLASGSNVELTVLTFQDSEFQKVEIITERLLIGDTIVLPEYILDEFGNKYANFKIPKNGNFEFELIANIKTQSILHNMTDYNISEQKHNYPSNFDIYLTSSPKIESDSSEIKTVTFNKFRSDSFIETLNEVVFWTNDYVEYASGQDFQRYYLLQLSAVNTLLDRKGVCDEFANLAAAVLRQKGIPTRIAVGVVFDGLNWGNHAWMEVYHKDFGWIPSDPTFREAGFVDATHIKIGSFRDISLSVAKATYPKNTRVNFQTQTLPQVTIKNRNYFSHVALTGEIGELKANQWNKVVLEIENKTDGILTVPIIARQNYPEIIISNKNKSVVLMGGEKKELTFNIYPKINLQKNQTARGVLTFNSLSEPIEKEIIITPNEKVENGEVNVNMITPITSQDKFMVDISIINKSQNTQKILIDLNNSMSEYNWTQTIAPFESKNFRKEIDFVNEKHLVRIETPTKIYLQEIIPIKTTTTNIIERPTENIIEQKITTTQTRDPIDVLTLNPLIILVALLVGISIILLGLFAVRKKYI